MKLAGEKNFRKRGRSKETTEGGKRIIAGSKKNVGGTKIRSLFRCSAREKRKCCRDRWEKVAGKTGSKKRLGESSSPRIMHPVWKKRPKEEDVYKREVKLISGSHTRSRRVNGTEDVLTFAKKALGDWGEWRKSRNTATRVQEGQVFFQPWLEKNTERKKLFFQKDQAAANRGILKKAASEKSPNNPGGKKLPEGPSERYGPKTLRGDAKKVRKSQTIHRGLLKHTAGEKRKSGSARTRFQNKLTKKCFPPKEEAGPGFGKAA